MSFTQHDYDTLLARLTALSDEGYRTFNEGLLPELHTTTLGVRIPLLRGIARELCRGDWRAFLDCETVRSSPVYEITLLAGLVTAGAKCPAAEKMTHTAAYIPRVKDWATNDVVCATYRIAPADKAAWRAFLTPYLTCGEEFGERFALTLLMDQFLTTESEADFLLDACTKARCPAYYTRMAVAWVLCTAFCKYREKTLAFLRSKAGQSLDARTFNKAIQKCRESRRVSVNDKTMLAAMKRKI